MVYVDDVLSISDIPEDALKGIQTVFKLKGDKMEPPEVYLGAELANMVTADGVDVWTMSSDKYCKAAVENVESSLAEDGKRLPTKCGTPLKSGYKPEEDVTPELNKEGVQTYQELIGVLRWACELGRVDVLLEMVLLSQHLAMPRMGHLDQVYHIFGYLKHNPKRKLAFDPTQPDISEKLFTEYEWFDFYRDAEEAVPGDMPEPLGNGMTTSMFVDADLAGNKVTRKSHTGILIFCCRAPIIWYSKKQNSVESSTFGSEFTALKTGIELIQALRYKLRMFGVPISGATNIFCDNEAVYKSTSVPESTLKKKHHSIAYHYSREAVAAGIVRVAKEATETNLADAFTKLLSRLRRETLFDSFTY